VTLSERLERGLTARRRTWLVRLLWVVVAAAVCVRVGIMLADPIQPTGYADVDNGYFLDFRDTVWTPGRFLLTGGNPYDPEIYLQANPWAWPFGVYAPVWLFLGLILGPLPFLAAVVVYQVIALALAIVMLRVLMRWAVPTLADIAVPAVLVWMNIWHPGRASLSVQMGTLLAVLGVTLVIRQLTNRLPVEPRVDRPFTLGIALTLIKPQFGLVPLLVGAAAGKLREVALAVLGLAVLSLPVAVLCAVAARGPVEFVRSILRNIAYSNSPNSPDSLNYPGVRRLDLVGILARHGLDVTATWVSLAVTITAFALAIAMVRITRNPLLLSAAISVTTLLGIYHSTYDLLLLLVPVAVGVGMIVRGELTQPAERVVFGALLLVVLHLHTVTKTLIPRFDVLGADTVNVVLMVVALVASFVGAAQARLRPATLTAVSRR
jgi:hypothetical protein